MLRRLFLVLSLALLLGIGQQGAAMHAISHFADEQGQSQDNKAHHAAFCDKCVTYASLGSAVDAGGPVFVPLADRELHSLEHSIHRFTSHTYHYSARAPPSLV